MLYPIFKIKTMNPLKNAVVLLALCVGNLYAQETITQDSLSLATRYLDEVVVLDSRLPLKRSQSGKTIVRIDQKQIERFNGRNIAEILDTQAGISVLGNRSITGQNLRMAIRGSNNYQVLILVDGVRVADPSRIDNDFDLNFLSLDQIDSIEILKGGASTLYGSAAAAAVINITTKKIAGKSQLNLALYTGTEVAQNAKYDAFTYLSNNINYAAASEKLQYKVGLSSLRTNGMSAVANGTEVDPFFRYNINAQLGNKGEKFSWTVMASKAKIENDYDNVFPVEDAEFSGTSDLESFSFNSSFAYAKGEFALNAGLQNTERDYRDNFPTNYSAKNSSLEVVNRLKFSDHLYSIQGFLFQEGSYEGATATRQNDLFANVVYVSDGGFNLNTGARLSNHQTYGNHFTYSLNPSYTLPLNQAQVKLLGSISTAFIAPSLFQLYDTYSGNADLAPEETQSIELGAVFELDDANASLVYFQRQEDPKIVYDFTTYAYANAPSDVVFQGVELSYANQVYDVVDLRLNYTFTELKEGDLLRLPKHSLNAQLGIPLSASEGLNAVFTHRGERQAVDTSLLDAYNIVDLSYAKTFGEGNLTARFWVSNLFDTEYVEIANFTTKGRNFRLGLNYHF